MIAAMTTGPGPMTGGDYVLAVVVCLGIAGWLVTVGRRHVPYVRWRAGR